MESDELLNAAAGFFRDHTLWALLISLAVGALVYWKPKDMFKLALAGLTLGAIIYGLSLVVDLTSQGIDASREFTKTPKIDVD